MKIVLDIGYNHNGKIEKAKQMIDELAEMRKEYPEIYGVKFQMWDVEGIPEDIKIQKLDKATSFGATYYTHRRRLELLPQEMMVLKEYTEARGLMFSCSGKDLKSFQRIVEGLQCHHVKVPSQFLLRHDIFEYLGGMKKQAGLTVYVSFGMHTDDEIRGTKYWRWADVKYYCVSLYPPRLDELNMAVLKRHGFNGYSSHEAGGAGIIPAVILGMEYFERHYTFDKNAKGSDHKISSDAKELSGIIDTARMTRAMMGSSIRKLTQDEIKNRMFYGRF
jgi:sialic acid synthase SpsE